jgi:hypothetical protein
MHGQVEGNTYLTEHAFHPGLRRGRPHRFNAHSPSDREEGGVIAGRDLSGLLRHWWFEIRDLPAPCMSIIFTIEVNIFLLKIR